MTVHSRTFPGLLRIGTLPNELGLVQVSPPDQDGMVTVGVTVEYAADVLLAPGC